MEISRCNKINTKYKNQYNNNTFFNKKYKIIKFKIKNLILKLIRV